MSFYCQSKGHFGNFQGKKCKKIRCAAQIENLKNTPETVKPYIRFYSKSKYNPQTHETH